MSSRSSAGLIQPVAVIAAVLAAFFFLIDPFRQVETVSAAGLLHLLGVAPGTVQVRPNSAIAVYPERVGAFLTIVTPACSALPSVLAVTSLTVFTAPRLRRHHVLALGCALLCVVTGNIIRIASSIAIGLVAGTSSLVLFHDWVGSLFAFAYTLGGYLLMLFMLLSAEQRFAGSKTGTHVT